MIDWICPKCSPREKLILVILLVFIFIFSISGMVIIHRKHKKIGERLNQIEARIKEREKRRKERKETIKECWRDLEELKKIKGKI